jgi:hypothetical protein
MMFCYACHSGLAIAYRTLSVIFDIEPIDVELGTLPEQDAHRLYASSCIEPVRILLRKRARDTNEVITRDFSEKFSQS